MLRLALKQSPRSFVLIPDSLSMSNEWSSLLGAWWCLGFVLLKTQGAGEGVNSGNDKFGKLLWKIPVFGMIAMNFMLVPADMFSISILFGVKTPTSVLNQIQGGFSEDTTAVCTYDTASVIRQFVILPPWLESPRI